MNHISDFDVGLLLTLDTLLKNQNVTHAAARLKYYTIGIVRATDGAISVRLVSDTTKNCDDNRTAYTPDIDNIGVDFGLATLLTTSEGDLHGRGLLADLVRIDRQITGIARHRQRAGGKPRDSERYRRLVARVRGMLKTRINRALNSIVEDRKPAELTIEHFNFRSPELSKRMNRIIQNCGRVVFKAKLVDLE